MNNSIANRLKQNSNDLDDEEDDYIFSNPNARWLDRDLKLPWLLLCVILLFSAIYMLGMAGALDINVTYGA
jgi:hypothetical protein